MYPNVQKRSLELIESVLSSYCLLLASRMTYKKELDCYFYYMLFIQTDFLPILALFTDSAVFCFFWCQQCVADCFGISSMLNRPA